MNKKFGKILIALMLVIVLAFGAFSGCKAEETGLLEEYKNRPNKVRVLHFNAGFGDKYLVAVAKYYMDNVDKDTYIEIKNTPKDAEEGIKLSSGTQTHDVYLLTYTYDYLTASNYLLDLRDIYDGKSYGEEVLVKDKIDDELEEKLYPANRNEIFFLPYGEGLSGYKFCYNYTTVENALGKNYTLPRTTDELFEFGDKLYKKGVFLTVAHYGDGLDYFSPEVWLAQAMGVDNYVHAVDGEYWDGSKWTFDENNPTVIEKNAQAYKDMYSVVSKLQLKSNGYMHVDSGNMDFMDAEKALSGLGYSTNKAKVAYHYNGSHVLNEARDYLDEQEEKGTPQTLRATKVPIISSVINQTTTIANDEVLRQVVDYVDGVIDTAPAGVSETDIATIRKARGVAATFVGGSLAIGKKAQNVEGCKDFVRFLTSDVAQKIASEAMGGLVRFPYGYNPYDDIKDDESIPQFIKDCLKIDKEITTLVSQGKGAINEVFVKYGGFKIIPELIYVFNNPSTYVSPDKYYENTLAYYNTVVSGKTQWQRVVKDYKKALGN